MPAPNQPSNVPAVVRLHVAFLRERLTPRQLELLIEHLGAQLHRRYTGTPLPSSDFFP